MNRPPAAASKIVTLTTSPMPKRISFGGGPWMPPASCGANDASTFSICGVILTIA
ncbi:hypothetical protein [Bradyrhizobium elkanii]